MGEKLLLHSCCGPCSTACIERLINEYDFDITIYYCNPCITDIDEYNKRKENQIRFINEFNSEEENRDRQITFVEGEYDPENYLESVKGLEKEPEGGKRCTVCFNQRLSHAADYAKENGFKIFTTTLTVSPHKNYKLIT